LDTSNPPAYVIAGRFKREYILPASGPVILDAPGGSLLYAAGGMAVWDRDIGLLTRVGEDLPRQWLRDLERHGFNTQGEMTVPKSLLGYQPQAQKEREPHVPDILTPSVADLPKEYLQTRAVHICPMEFTTQSQLAAAFRSGTVTAISLDPLHSLMTRKLLRDLRLLLQGITIFLPSEGELRSLFWGETHDLWEMVEEIGSYGCEIIIVKRGVQGQLVYDVAGKHRWEIGAYDSRRVDPTGAGDAFGGGCLAGYQRTLEPLEAALHGSVSASLKIEGSGALYPLEVLPGLAQARYEALRNTTREL
jgi:sugar/nucleoside kinase (ribokinase family)